MLTGNPKVGRVGRGGEGVGVGWGRPRPIEIDGGSSKSKGGTPQAHDKSKTELLTGDRCSVNFNFYPHKLHEISDIPLPCHKSKSRILYFTGGFRFGVKITLWIYNYFTIFIDLIAVK